MEKFEFVNLKKCFQRCGIQRIIFFTQDKYPPINTLLRWVRLPSKRIWIKCCFRDNCTICTGIKYYDNVRKVKRKICYLYLEEMRETLFFKKSAKYIFTSVCLIFTRSLIWRISSGVHQDPALNTHLFKYIRRLV